METKAQKSFKYIEVTPVLKTYPKVDSIVIKDLKNCYNSQRILINRQIFGNCQSISLIYACKLLEIKKEALIELLINFQIVNKTQCIMDIKEKYLDDMKKTLKPFYNSFKIKRYTSTNGSKMVICIVQFKYKNELEKLNI